MFKNIVLDMGNVLLRYDPEIPLQAFCSSEEERNIIRRELFEGPEWIQGDLGTISDGDRYELVRGRVPSQYWPALKRCAEEWDICMTPMEGAQDFCAYLRQKDYRLYILSNASDKFYTYFPRYFPLDSFEGLVVSCDIHLLKPNLPIYRHLLEKHGLTAGECLFLDDMPANVQGACEAGLHGVLFQNNFDRLLQEFQL